MGKNPTTRYVNIEMEIREETLISFPKKIDLHKRIYSAFDMATRRKIIF